MEDQKSPADYNSYEIIEVKYSGLLQAASEEFLHREFTAPSSDDGDYLRNLLHIAMIIQNKSNYGEAWFRPSSEQINKEDSTH